MGRSTECRTGALRRNAGRDRYQVACARGRGHSTLREAASREADAERTDAADHHLATGAAADRVRPRSGGRRYARNDWSASAPDRHWRDARHAQGLTLDDAVAVAQGVARVVPGYPGSDGAVVY